MLEMFFNGSLYARVEVMCGRQQVAVVEFMAVVSASSGRQ